LCRRADPLGRYKAKSSGGAQRRGGPGALTRTDRAAPLWPHPEAGDERGGGDRAAGEALPPDTRARSPGAGGVAAHRTAPPRGGEGGGRARQRPGGPAIAREEGVIAAVMARAESAEGAEEVGDGMGADGEDGGQGQQDEAAIGGPSEGRGQGVEDVADRGGEAVVDAVDAAARGASLASTAAGRAGAGAGEAGGLAGEPLSAPLG